MEILDELPYDWRISIQEAYNDLYAEIMVPPDALALPWSWLHVFQVLLRQEGGTGVTKFNGMEVSFGFVDEPTCSVKLNTLQRHLILNPSVISYG